MEGHGRSFLVGRSWTVILVRTFIDVHGRSLFEERSWMVIFGRTVMDADFW